FFLPESSNQRSSVDREDPRGSYRPRLRPATHFPRTIRSRPRRTLRVIPSPRGPKHADSRRISGRDWSQGGCSDIFPTAGRFSPMPCLSGRPVSGHNSSTGETPIMVMPLGDENPTRIVPVVNYGIIALNVLVFFLQQSRPETFTIAYAA